MFVAAVLSSGKVTVEEEEVEQVDSVITMLYHHDNEYKCMS